MVTAYAKRIGDIKLGKQMGWQVEGDGSELRWNKPYHPVFNVPIEWLTLDPGEAPMQALNRAIGERYIRHFMRNDGTLMVLRPDQQSPEWIIEASERTDVDLRQDFRAITTQVRVWSAYAYSDFVDESNMRVYGRRFKEVNNPNVYTEDEAAVEAESIFHETRAGSERISFTMPFSPFIEPEDMIQVPEGKYFVESFSVEVASNSIKLSIDGRKYTYAPK
jgi:hypothetical protein